MGAHHERLCRQTPVVSPSTSPVPAHGLPLGSRMWSRVAALILANVGIARIGGNLFPLTLQDEINGRDFILGLDDIQNWLRVLGTAELPHIHQGVR